MRLLNHKSYEKADIKKQEMEVIDNNIVRHIGMTRIASRKPTPFQNLLDLIAEGKFIIENAQIKSFTALVFNIPSLG